ncbi:MAG TPA: adenylate/guanylate cyclase domain-containing protein [Rhodopila sp.]|nr:adenylate/guanylate cyclase domain-containing protein [Rhodopila sp.]
MLRRPFVSKQHALVPASPPARRWGWSASAPNARWRAVWPIRPKATTPPVTRLLTAVHADMVGYSRLFQQDDAGTVARLTALHWERFVPAISHFKGQLVQTGGDSLLALFDSVAQAVRCAVALQCDIASDNGRRPADHPLQLRIGVDLGDVIMDGLNFHGDGVIIATRLQAVCPPGGVCVSRAVYERGGERLGLATHPLGTLALKHVAHPVEAFVLWPPHEWPPAKTTRTEAWESLPGQTIA